MIALSYLVPMQQRQIMTTMIVVIAVEVVKLDECIWQKVQSTMATFAFLGAKEKRFEGTQTWIGAESFTIPLFIVQS